MGAFQIPELTGTLCTKDDVPAKQTSCLVLEKNDAFCAEFAAPDNLNLFQALESRISDIKRDFCIKNNAYCV